MNKFLSICLLLILPAMVFAQPSTEKTGNVNLAVMQGPTGFSSVNLDDFINVQVFASPDEAISKLVKGELDMAVLPANSAINVYNKGVDIKFVAIVGEGMLSVLGYDKNSKTIAVPGLGGTPDHMQQLLYKEYEPSYSVTAPAQVAQLLIAKKCDLAILPQPFVSMVLSGNSECKVISNVQDRWKELTGFDQFPMSVLVVRSSFAENNRNLVSKVKESYKSSIDWVISNPVEAGKKIEEIGIMKAALATGAVDKCALVYKDGKNAQKELNSYYEVLLSLAPDAIGGKLPDKDFWY